jgi:cysteine desulfurase / selenocysteine lyase
MFDPQAVRRQFPVFDQTLPKGLPVTFLDSAASAQKPQRVIDAERQVQQTHYANAYRGVYRFGARIDDELEATRETVRNLIGAGHAEEILFTSGTTMSLNVVAFGWGRTHLKPGDEILLNVMEHHANLVCWQQVARETGAVLRYLPLTGSGELDLDRLDEFLTEKTRIVAVTAMSNVLGTLNPIRTLARKAHAVGAVIAVDGAQSVPHGPVDVIADEIDFLAFSGHKLYGPTGVGVLYGKREHLEAMEPLIFGGHMISQVHLDRSTWADLPAKFEAGTIPIVQAIALREAVEFVNELGFDAIHAHERDLLTYAHERLHSIDGMRIHGPPPERKGAIVSFTVEGASPEDLAQLLDRRGVFVRHGHHCTMPLHEWLGVSATVRASFGVYNLREEIDRLVDAIRFAREKLRLT